MQHLAEFSEAGAFTTCHATARPFAVSRPVNRLLRMPGPLVTEMKSGSRSVSMFGVSPGGPSLGR
jgi:hypothetical protein